MDDLADNIKTKSLTEALESLTDQVLEISSLTAKDLRDRPKLKENLHLLSEGISISTHNFCDILRKKLKSINSSINACIPLNELLLAAREAATFSLELSDPENLEAFQDRLARLLEMILKVILLWDKELINGLQQTICTLKRPLIGLKKTQLLHEILTLYKEFINQFVEFTGHLYHRINDLVDRRIQNEFWIHLSCAHKLTISFSDVIKNNSRYPLSKHSRISKEFVIKELLSFLDEIEELLSLEQPTKIKNQFQLHGASFLTAIDEILEQLERSHFDEDEMQSRMHLILQHSMTVSKFSTKEDCQQITRDSQRVLNEYRSLQSMLKNLEQSPSDIPLAVDILRDLLEILEQSVNHSLLRMMVENLSICTEPIRLLIKRCPLKAGESSSLRSKNDLVTEVQEFDSVMERVLQTCFFALSSTGDMLKIQVIRCALKLLESLEAEMVPAVYSCYLDPDDKAAGCHLQFLWRSFRQHCDHLQNSLDSIADPVAFCHVGEKVLSEHVIILRKDLYSQNSDLLERHCRPMAVIAARCLALLEQQNWGKLLTDQLYLKEIKLSLREFRGAVQLTIDNISDLSSHRSMLKRAELLLKYLMKSIDTMKQVQDSDLFPFDDAAETLRNTVMAAPSILAFPDNVTDLPCDPSVSDVTLCISRRSRIGRTPKHKIQRSYNEQQNKEQDYAEVTRFIDTTKPWRKRGTPLITIEDSFHHDLATKSREETFDLTELLEELSTLEETLTSAQASTLFVKSLTPWTPDTLQSVNTIPLNVSIRTPNRLKELRIVTERLARFRRQQSN